MMMAPKTTLPSLSLTLVPVRAHEKVPPDVNVCGTEAGVHLDRLIRVPSRATRCCILDGWLAGVNGQTGVQRACRMSGLHARSRIGTACEGDSL